MKYMHVLFTFSPLAILTWDHITINLANSDILGHFLMGYQQGILGVLQTLT